MLYPFGALDTSQPVSGVALDAAGNLYGTTSEPSFQNPDLGSVYKISASGGYSILHGFSPVGFEDGAYPYAGVVLDASDNIYGTTSAGGFAGYGVVYMLIPSGAETILHVFSGGADGATPYSGVSLDSAGNLYGTTYAGGNGFGVVYELTPAGEETILYRFTGSADGAYPNAGVILDSTGNLYGTTTQAHKEVPGMELCTSSRRLERSPSSTHSTAKNPDPIRRAGSSSIRKGIYSGPLRRAEVAEAGWSLSCARQRSESRSILIGAA